MNQVKQEQTENRPHRTPKSSEPQYIKWQNTVMNTVLYMYILFGWTKTILIFKILYRTFLFIDVSRYLPYVVFKGREVASQLTLVYSCFNVVVFLMTHKNYDFLKSFFKLISIFVFLLNLNFGENVIVSKLGTEWGANPSTLRTSAPALCMHQLNTVPQHGSRSRHTSLLDVSLTPPII